MAAAPQRSPATMEMIFKKKEVQEVNCPFKLCFFLPFSSPLREPSRPLGSDPGGSWAGLQRNVVAPPCWWSLGKRSVLPSPLPFKRFQKFPCKPIRAVLGGEGGCCHWR